MEALDILKKYWGYSQFRPMQMDIIQSILQNKDTLALLPTGGGKSICYQVPALMQEGVCLVISPLIALMKDQVDALKEKKIRAIAINSTLGKREMQLAIDNALAGAYKFIYLSPERLVSDNFRTILQNINVSFIAIDEAHCISQWGHDFRPEYRRINEVRELFKGKPCLALTATATPKVVDDICESLQFKNHQILRASFARPNLSYNISYTENKTEKLVEICKALKGSGLIFVNTRKATKEIAAILKSEKISSDFYHAGLEVKTRNAKQTSWIQNKTRIIACTNAFGMGIDKADVQFVVHYEMPQSPEAYFQEAGRAGRNGNKSFAVLLYSNTDRLKMEEQMEKTFPSKEFVKSVYSKLCSYLNIGFDEGDNTVHDFDLYQFCKKTNLEMALVWSSLKILERNELFFITENYEHSSSKLKVLYDNFELQNYMERHPKSKSVLEYLIRNYDSIYSDYQSISETTIAKKLEVEEEDIVKQLEYLKSNGVVNYLPVSSKLLIGFLKRREKEEHLQLSKESYDILKKTKQAQLDAIIKFCTTTNICRSVFLRQYFGEKTSSNCGICDYCRSSSDSIPNQIELEKLKVLIFQKIKEPIDIQNLIKEIKFNNQNKIAFAINYFYDHGVIVIDSKGIVSING